MGDAAALAKLASDALTGGHREHDIRYWRTTARRLAAHVNDHAPAEAPVPAPATLDEARIALFQAFNPGFDFGPDHPDWASYGEEAERLLATIHNIQADSDSPFYVLKNRMYYDLWSIHFPAAEFGPEERYVRYYKLVSAELVTAFTGRVPDAKKAGLEIADAVISRFRSSVSLVYPDDLTPSGRRVLLQVVEAAEADLAAAKQAGE